MRSVVRVHLSPLISLKIIEYGGLAQLGERLPCKQEVAGSIPTISTNFELKMDGSGQRLVRFDLVSKETGVCTLKTEQCITK